VEGEKRLENWCRQLLRRYGVVFRELLANESASPRWGELVRHYRRMEARGEIRYGRFVDGVAGEQFGLPEAIPLLRSADRAGTGSVELPATDPINLTGRIVVGPRVPALPGHAISIVDGAMKSPERGATRLNA
jgi:ATP-dependent Lhr-like helicase